MFIRRYISKVVPNALNELWSLMQAKLKVESQIKSSILTEVFPVNVGNLPRLYAYRLDATGDLSTIGGKLSYKLTTCLPWPAAEGGLDKDGPG